MKLQYLIIGGILLASVSGIRAQVKPNDTVPVFLADSINTVYIYADTGTALNRIDKEGRKQGLWQKKYSDGNLQYRGHFSNDKPYGIFKNYYDIPDSLQSVRSFSHHGSVCYTHIFYTTGALMAEGKYVNEKRDSIWKSYDDMQRLILKSQYADGKRDGKSVVFYPDGNVLEIKNWKNDTEEGVFRQYYDEGGIREEGTYVHGKMEDTLYIYDMDGKIAKKGTYLNDMHEGNWIDYYDGTPKDTLIYHRGSCLNCYKYTPTKKQEDSLKMHYQQLQQQLDNPSNLEEEYQQPDDGGQ